MVTAKKKSNTPVKKTVKVAAIVSICMLVLGLLANYIYFNVAIRVPDLPKPPLKELATARGVELGVLTYPRHLKDDVFREVLLSQYRVVTSDAEIHWDKLRPTPEKYDFSQIDQLVGFAAKHDMKVQAHHLVWNEDDSLPKWLKNGQYTKDQLYEIMESHINTVVGRYKGRVSDWSVVNEHFTRVLGTYNLDNWWSEQFDNNTEYIDKAFSWARQADPAAILLLNDFNNETKTKVSDLQYDYMKSAKERGVPIDGIGMQMHLDATRPPNKDAMVANMKRFGELGYKVYITEFDISSSTVKGDLDYKHELEARITKDVVRACVESNVCVGLVNFGMTDITKFQSFTHSRQRSNLLTKRFQPKPAFYSFRDAWLLR